MHAKNVRRLEIIYGLFEILVKKNTQLIANYFNKNNDHVVIIVRYFCNSWISTASVHP